MSTTIDLAGLINQFGQLATESITVPIMITDSRHVFGRVDVLVVPMGGSGSQWVDLNRVMIDK